MRNVLVLSLSLMELGSRSGYLELGAHINSLTLGKVVEGPGERQRVVPSLSAMSFVTRVRVLLHVISILTSCYFYSSLQGGSRG
jgi:hypothetical protein